MYYTIYVGGERKDRANTIQDSANVSKVLHAMDQKSCYTKIFNDDRFIGQAEHVLPVLVDISYIPTLDDAIIIVNKLKDLGVTECTLVTCTDSECLNEIESVEMSLAV